MSRILKYFLIVLLAITGIIVVAGLIISRFYQDEVREMMIGEINKHVTTEIRVKEISFSVLRRFPRASVEFRDVLIKVPEDYINVGIEKYESDTLFTAQNLFLQFNLKDIFRQRYRVTNINARNGLLYLAVNADGQENYRFWKTSGSTGEGFEFNVQDVRFSGYRLKYGNHIKKFYLDTDLRRVEMTGNFSPSSFRLSGDIQGTNRELRNQGLRIAAHQDFSMKALLHVTNDLIIIEEGTIEFSGIRLLANGEYDSKGNSINMDFKGENLDISKFVSILPSATREELDRYRFDGVFDFEAAVTGNLSGTQSPSITAGFITRKGGIQSKETGVRLRDVNLEGKYANGNRQSPESSSIVISSFSSVFGKGNISGNAGISNLSRPSVNFDIKASFMLEELAGFYQPGNIQQMAGAVRTSLSGRGQLEKFAMPGIREIDGMNLDGYLEIEDGMLAVFEGRHIASQINGELKFGNRVSTPGLSFNVGNDHFSIDGEIDNGLPWLLGDDITMSISGNLYSRNLNIDNYLEVDAPETHDQSGEPEKLLFPRNLDLALDFHIDNLKFRKFNAAGFAGRLAYKPYMLTINTVDFNSLEGSVSGNGVIIQRVNGDFIIQSQLQMQHIDIQTMFLAFNNFGQTFIHGENLKGSLTGNLGFISEWDRDLKHKSDRIVADSKVEIRNGELIDFEPMLGLARYIDVAELRHIRFSTINNEIYIRNKIVTIPQMDINSSAINISGSGTHNFDGHFDYKLRVNLSDVLYGRASRSKPENTKYGIVEDDGLGRTSLYLLVSGNAGDYNVSYDHRAVREVIRDNIANERNVLRQLFRDEFGWFASDSTTRERRDEGSSSGQGFSITWEEEDEKGSNHPVENSQPAGSSNQPTQRKFEIIWEEEDNP